jgi:hypothetical protein
MTNQQVILSQSLDRMIQALAREITYNNSSELFDEVSRIEFAVVEVEGEPRIRASIQAAESCHHEA